ncbi:MAG: hypothetical protein ACE14M_04615 [Terriglobales bacterium]
MAIESNDVAGKGLTGAVELQQVLNGGEQPVLTRPLYSRRTSVLVFVLTFTVSAAYAFARLKVGWVPGDDGLLAQSAWRVLQGQLPHRDFVDGYTGGLSFLHAAAFRVWGTNLVAMRWTVFLGFLAWLPAVFFVATRFASVVPAAGITVVAAVWSLPTYPAAMPSWYNLFFAVLGMASLLRYIEVGGRKWLFVAGLLGGASILIKIIGLYYVAAVLLFLVYREQQLAGDVSCGEQTHAQPFSCAYRWFSTISLITFLTLLLLMMRQRFDEREFVHFFLPSAVLAFLLVRREARISGVPRRFSALFGMILPFAAGILLPILVFLVPYVVSGSLGVFFQGANRSGSIAALGAIRPLAVQSLLYAVPLVAVLTAGTFWDRLTGGVRGLVISFALVLLLLTAKYDGTVAAMVWRSAIVVTPIIVALGAAVLLARPRWADGLSRVRDQQLMLVLAMAAVCSLVQFPFSAPIYFCYCAPLTALACFALLSTRKQLASSLALASVLGFYALFAVAVLVPNRIFQRWLFLPKPPAVETLRLERAGGLRVEAAPLFENVVALAQERSTNGLLLASPECPELYFLSGLRNPTRNDSFIAPRDLLRVAQEHEVNVIVLNERAFFGRGAITPGLLAELGRQYPHTAAVGRYQVYWRR